MVVESPVLNTQVDDPSHPLHHHRRIVTDFEYGDILGEGSYSTVLVGKDKKTEKLYAIKRLDKAHIVKNNKVKYVMIERDALSKMNHPGIVKLYWTFKDNQSLYFVLDLAKNGELYTYIRRLAPFDLNIAQHYAAEILLAIEHIHHQGVIHRDIKPENILLDDNMHIKITDFGSAKILSDQQQQQQTQDDSESTRSFVGTAEYVSPELLSSEPVSKEADYWAFGCVIYQMLSGKSPFKAPTDYLIFQKIKNLEYTMPDNFPEVAKDIIRRLLVKNPRERLGAGGKIDDIKQHPFFENIDWNNLFIEPSPYAYLREKLAEELRKNPPPQVDDVWFNQDENDPFGDPQQQQSYPPSTYSPPHHHRHHLSQQSSLTRISSSSNKEDKHVVERIGEQSHPLWIPHLYPNESIVKSGRVIRRRGLLFSKKRNLILTNRPRLLYLDPGTDKDKLDGNLRCEIPWTSQLLPELKGKSTFCIHTVSYYCF
ncbi:Putative AGC/PDK1 protein kinase [Rhizopus microsporus]|nr:Putative AGC/PDK1 protein kinase [Rhizopus microsporus]